MQVTEVYNYCPTKSVLLPLYNNKVQAGFPSPAEDYMASKLDLNTYLIKHPSSTFFVRVTGDSMIGAGIKDNDLLVVDRSINATNNKVVVGVVNNEFTVKRLKYIKQEAYLVPENDNYQPIKLGEGDYIWGVVTSVISQL